MTPAVTARVWSRRGVAAIVIVCAGVVSVPAAAVQPPDPATLPLIQERCEAAPQVRVTTRRGVHVLHRPIVDLTGITARPQGRPALIVAADAPLETKRFGWEDIERVDEQRSSGLRPAVIGFVAGLALGTGIFLLSGADFAESGDRGTAWLGIGIVMAGTGAGIMVGALRPNVSPIHP